jgi:lysophospholipase L1-like esterase
VRINLCSEKAIARFCMLILCVAASAWSQDVRHAYLCSDIGAERVFKVSAADEIVWEYPAKQCADAWLLPNGNVLMSFTDGAGDGKIANRGAREVTPDKKVVWEYKTTSEVWSCQRLADGNTLVAECTAKRLIEVDAAGAIVKTIPVKSVTNGHGVMRLARKLDNGHYLVGHLDDKAVREYDADGTVLREINVPDVAFSAVRLNNGNTLIGYRGGVVEVNAQDKTVWHLTQQDLPDLKLYWICNLQRLSSGNTVVNNWFIHQRRTDSPAFFEVTPDKKVVWRAALDERMGDPTAIQIMETENLKIQNGEQIIAIGDSITAQGGYLRDMDAVFARQYADMKIPAIINAGIGGQKAEDLIARFDKDVIQKKPALVTIDIGINDVWHRVKEPHSDEVLKNYRANVTRMVETAQAAGIRVLLCTPTLIEENANSEGNRRLAMYCDAVRQIAAEKNCLLADLHTLFLQALARKPADTQGNAITGDGVHMNATGDWLMARGILKALGVPEEKVQELIADDKDAGMPYLSETGNCSAAALR